jgi:hypothetical protein
LQGSHLRKKDTNLYQRFNKKWDTSINMVIRVQVGQTVCFLVQLDASPFYTLHTGSEAHPASYLVGSRIISSVIKQPGHKPSHSSSPSAAVKNVWSYTSPHPHVSMTQCFVWHQGKCCPCLVITVITAFLQAEQTYFKCKSDTLCLYVGGGQVTTTPQFSFVILLSPQVNKRIAAHSNQPQMMPKLYNFCT